MQEFNPLYLHPHKYNQWSKVPRGPVAVAVGSFLFGATAAASITVAGVSLATIGGFLITTAVASWAMSALMPKPQGFSAKKVCFPTVGNLCAVLILSMVKSVRVAISLLWSPR